MTADAERPLIVNLMMKNMNAVVIAIAVPSFLAGVGGMSELSSMTGARWWVAYPHLRGCDGSVVCRDVLADPPVGEGLELTRREDPASCWTRRATCRTIVA